MSGIDEPKNYPDADIQRRQEEEAARQKEILRAYEEELNNRSKRGVSADALSVGSLVTRAKQFIESSEWNSAKAYFDKALEREPQCAEAWWGLLLVEFNAHSPSEILDRLDWKAAEKIETSRNFRSAVEYADPKLKGELEAFCAQLHDASRWWTLYLAEMGVNDEREILERLDIRLMQSTEESKNFYNADKYSRDELKERICNFKDALYSAESYWRLFLQDFGVQSEEAFYDSLNDDKLKLLESNVNYQKSVTLATGGFRQRIEKFHDTVYSGELWWRLFLRRMNVENEQAMLTRFVVQQYQSLEENAYFQNAKKFASEQFAPRIAAFEKQAEEQYNAYKKAAACWSKLLKEFNCKSDSDLNALDFFVVSHEYYRDALDWAKKSCVQAVIARFENVGEVQKNAVMQAETKRKDAFRAKRKAVVSRALSLAVLLILFAGIATGVLLFVFRKNEWGFLSGIAGIESVVWGAFALPQKIALFAVLGLGFFSLIVTALRKKPYAIQALVWIFQLPAWLFVLVMQYLYGNVEIGSTTTWALCVLIALYMCVIFASQCGRGRGAVRLELCLPNLLVIAIYLLSLLCLGSVAGRIELFPLPDSLQNSTYPSELSQLFPSVEIALVFITVIWIIFIYCMRMQYRILSFIFIPVCIFAISCLAMPESGHTWLAIVVIAVTFVILFAVSIVITAIRRKMGRGWRE